MTDKPRPKDEPGDPATKKAPASKHPHANPDNAPDAREPDPNNPDSGGGRDPR